MASNRCAHTHRSGRQCRADALEGERYCDRHAPKPIATDPEQVLIGLMGETDKRVKLRASIAYIRWLATNKKECPKCAADQQRQRDLDNVYARMTRAQVQLLTSLAREVRALKDTARRQPICDDPNKWASDDELAMEAR